MAKLIIREGPGRGTSYEIMGDSAKIGRDPVNDVQVPSETVSRAHAIVEKDPEDPEAWIVVDLQSKNGVYLNGRRVQKNRLTTGDELRLGEVALTFVEQEFDTIEIELSAEGEPLQLRDVYHGQTAERAPTPSVTDSGRRLSALLELNRLAGSARSFPELFNAITGAIQKNLDPHRTVPILFDEQKGNLRPWVSQKGEFDKALARVPISTTIVNMAREKRAGILSEAARDDRRLQGAVSITEHRITSAMCAPIILGERLLGAIYVDRLGDAEPFNRKDLEFLSAFAAQAATAIENVRVREEMGRERYVRERESRGRYDIIGQCTAMEGIYRFISKAAPSDAGVLIEGDSGTGKELVARAVHFNSRRRHQPFEAVNCAAMAPTLLESELFGHVRGAYTGADREKPGRFELADGGTLFLDEIGELPESSQSKLLRVIEMGELRRLGDVRDRRVDVRVLAATNKRLADEVAAGRFREDLYFRLNVLHVSLPPLKERGTDIRLLAEHFLRQYAEKCGRPELRFDDKVRPLFESYSWPGNVRELKNAIERMVVMSERDVLKLEDVPFDIRSGVAMVRGNGGEHVGASGEMLSLKDLEKLHIQRVLRRTGGNKKEAARILGIDRSTLYSKLKAYGLEGGPDDADAGEPA
jgi:Nif-specific regulatory protein